jgi:VTC domain-containing protein
MLNGARSLTAAFEPIALDAVAPGAGLQSRFDSKYILGWGAFEALCASLAESHFVLEADGHRVFTYDTVYFDTTSLMSYRDHVRQRRKRFKARARRYVETSRFTFEVKLVGRRGITDKRVLLYDRDSHGTMDDRARAFLQQSLLQAYGYAPGEELRPTLRTTYRRISFVGRAGDERLTCDFHLAARHLVPEWDIGLLGALASDRVIVEHKSLGPGSGTRAALRALGVRPVSCSKYCLGIALTRPDVPSNPFRRLMRTHFHRFNGLNGMEMSLPAIAQSYG